MRRSYQLSKIGKEKRKSGSFRLCGQKGASSDSGDVTSIWASLPILDRLSMTYDHPLIPVGRSKCQHAIDAKPAKRKVDARQAQPCQKPEHACLAGRRIKKLPQVGQEPVEAVESEHSNS